MDNSYPNCERIFSENAPFYHIYTTPPEREMLFVSEDDFKEATNMLALASTESGVRMLSYAIMSNHLHSILAASKPSCEAYGDNLRKRLGQFLRSTGKKLPPIGFHAVEIESLKQLRDEIAYVIRNPYAARTDVNPFSHPWCSGYLYFNEQLPLFPKGIPAPSLSIVARRALKHGRDPEIYPSLRVLDGMITPSSFVDYTLAMSMYENVRQFIWCTTRNVEAYTATAARLGETGILTDEEAYVLAIKCCKKEFGSENPRLLTQQQKSQLIRTLKFEYGASNKQLARCTGISLQYIHEMFPLGARRP